MSKVTMKYEFGGKGNSLKIQVEKNKTSNLNIKLKKTIERFKEQKRIY